MYKELKSGFKIHSFLLYILGLYNVYRCFVQYLPFSKSLRLTSYCFASYISLSRLTVLNLTSKLSPIFSDKTKSLLFIHIFLNFL